MSGGAYDYAYGRIENLAADIRGQSPLRRAFRTHLLKVAKACHDIEWVDSGDKSPGDEDEAICECLGKNTDALVLEELLVEARRIHAELGEALERSGREPNPD